MYIEKVITSKFITRHVERQEQSALTATTNYTCVVGYISWLVGNNNMPNTPYAPYTLIDLIHKVIIKNNLIYS